jgi:hypothetical protein
MLEGIPDLPKELLNHPCSLLRHSLKQKVRPHKVDYPPAWNIRYNELRRRRRNDAVFDRAKVQDRHSYGTQDGQDVHPNHGFHSSAQRR